MSKRWYNLEGQYRLPAGKLYAIALAAVYIDGDLFHYNIPIVDGRLLIWVKPQNTHTLLHRIDFGIPSFQNGVVERIATRFDWWPGQDHWQSGSIEYMGYPYGMGVNTIAIEMYVDTFPLLRDIVYDVSMSMEVEL